MVAPKLLLTGGSGEIGGAIAQTFRTHGFDVIAPDRKTVDLEDAKHVEAYLAQFNSPVETFIHCAGFNEPKPMAEITPHDLQKTMQINATAFYQISHHLVKNNLLQPNGFILGVSSIYGFLSRRGRFSYAASKHCLNGMVKTLAIELGAQNIKVNAIAPGFVDTKLTRKNNSEETIQRLIQKVPLGRLAAAADIAEVAYFLCSPNNRFLTGQEIVVDGGYSIGGFE